MPTLVRLTCHSWVDRGCPTSRPARAVGQCKEKTMKRDTTTLAVSALFLAVALPCLAQVKELPTQTTTVAGTIETIDQGKRAMNIKTADGKFVSVNVPE